MSSNPITIEPMYVVDTHALIWYLTTDKKLGANARQIFRAAEQGDTLLILPAIMLAELYYANGKHNWFSDFNAVYQRISSQPYFQLLPLEPQHIIEFAQDMAVPEMHDRIITGVARRLQAPMLTSDPLIIKANIVSTVW